MKASITRNLLVAIDSASSFNPMLKRLSSYSITKNIVKWPSYIKDATRADYVQRKKLATGNRIFDRVHQMANTKATMLSVCNNNDIIPDTYSTINFSCNHYSLILIELNIVISTFFVCVPPKYKMNVR